jgi:hypothetical protein
MPSLWSRGGCSQWCKEITLLAVFMWLVCLIGYGQTGQGTISGTVSDQSGASVAQARVTAKNTGTGLERTTTTSESGSYALPNLPVGTYDVTVVGNQFKTQNLSGVVLTTDQAATVNFTLQVGSVTESVTVSGNQDLIETASPTLNQVVGERAIQELPLNGREPAALVNTAPGAVSGTQSNAFVFENTCCTWPVPTGATINGGRMGTTAYLLDGGLNMDSYTYAPAPFPNADATQEFRVATNNYDIRYGYSSSGIVNIVTKSGTNQWHGNLFEFVRNDMFNAANYFSHEVDPLKRNQFGGSIGGRIIRDKLFVFGNIQGTIERVSQTGQTAFVPTAAELAGDFSSTSTQLINANTGLPYANNFIDPSTFNPVALKIEESIPKTTSPDGLVHLPAVPFNDHYKEFTIRADYYPTQKQQISFRTFFDDFDEPGFDGAGDLIGSHNSLATRFQSYTGNWTWTLNPSLVNHLVVSYGKLNVTSFGDQIGADGKPVCLPCYGTKIADFPQFPPVLDLFSVSGGFTIVGNTNFDPRWNAQVSESVNWTKGKHLVVAGVDVIRQDMSEETDFLARPLVAFTGEVSGSSFADFLLGQASFFQQAGGEATHPRGNLYGLFVGDTYRVTPNLVIDAGLRWEPFFPPTVVGGRMTLFRQGLQSTRYPNAPTGLVFPGDRGVPEGGFDRELLNFEPRLGIAWQPKALPNTAIRAAYGIFISPNLLNDYPHSADGAPFSPNFVLNPGPDLGPYIDLSDPFKNVAGTGGVSPFPPFASPTFVPPASTAFALPVSLQDNFETHFTLGKTQAWNLSLEHQFGGNLLVRVSYVGRESYHLQSPFELNPGFFSAGGARLRQPNFGTIVSNVAWSTASYNGFQAVVEHRFSHGFELMSNFTHSKAIDSSSLGTTAYSSALGDPFDLGHNRGLSDLNFPNIWSNKWVYELPSFRGLGTVGSKVLGNWQVSGVWQLSSGTPFSIVGGFGNNNSLAQIGGDRADLTGAAFQVHSGSKAHWLQQYFNPAAFTTNAPGTFGNSPRNVLAGPGNNNVDLSIAKNIPFRERYKFQLRWEMFNAFNRTHFGLPQNDPSSDSFGEIVSAGPARVMQLGAKLDW